MNRDPESLWQLAACGLLRTSGDGTIRVCNATFCQWSGYSREELVDNRRFQDLLTSGARIFYYTHWEPLLRMQGSVSEVKLEITDRSGTALPVVVNAIRRTDGDVVVHDIAVYVARDRDRYERELVAARRRVEELHEIAKLRATFAEQMVGIVSHDLRNPLNAIHMCGALLHEMTTNEDQHRVLARLDRATGRATQLIGDLLDFTQARLGGGLSVTRTSLELHDVVEDVVEELRLAHPGASLVHVREGSGPSHADAGRLAQLVGNLVSNAVTYGDTSAPVTVTTTTGPRSSIAVHNAGPPVPSALQQHVFEPMTRGVQAHDKGRSVGLGLYIVREIARAHGGEAAMTSTTEAGTTITVSWPGGHA